MPPDLPDPQPKKRNSCVIWLLVFIAFLVLLVIGIVVCLPYFLASTTSVILDACVTKAKADVKGFETVIIRYRTGMNSMPSSLEDLIRRPTNVSGPWRRLMSEDTLNDPWGQPYQYRNPGVHNPNSYDVYSKGPDMKDGTEDDIGNWQN
ncbi:MAG: type II secretion system protein GspG [Verrucomicrobiaceae bacterium]|nr:type II secretion system protein GspG [Verrucomicrobiaceae bacterium]